MDEVTQSGSAAKDSERRDRIGDGLKTLLLSLCAYLIVFAFEAGYCVRFGVPLDFIRLDVTRLLVCAAALVSLLGLGIWLASSTYHTINQILSSKLPQAAVLVAPFLILSSAGLIIAVASDFSFWPSVFCIGMPFILLAIEICKIALSKEATSFEGRLKVYARPREEKRRFLEFVSARLGDSALIFGFSIAYLVVLSCLAGYSQACRQRIFLIIEGPRPLVVLRVYGDRIICAPFLEDSKQIESSYIINDIGKGFDGELKRRLVGPLSVK